jgi:regulatory protein
MSTGLDFDLRMPEPARDPFARRKPTATLVVRSDSGVEEWRLPKRVARLLESSLTSGEFEPMSRAELAYKVSELSRSAGRTRVAELLDKRDYASAELRQKLVDDGYSRKLSDDLVSRAVDVGLVDDARFADVFVRSKVSAGWGRVKIERELARRGVSIDLLDGWPQDYLDHDCEFDNAYRLASRRRITGKNDFQKIVRFLCGRGYPMGVSMDVAHKVLDERDEED